MQGYYHSIEDFGTVDGQGIRFVLFLSGCSLGCAFCHNPDTWSQSDQFISVQQVLSRYEEYRVFYEASGGGITVSGGEPLQQAEFVAELFAACQERGISTTLDTSGHAPLSALCKVLQHTDEVLFCLKAASESRYKQLTNCGINNILHNLKYAAANNNITVRYVVIPNITDELADIYALAKIVRELGNVAIELLPYHNFGLSKWQELGMDYKLAHVHAAKSSDMERVTEILEQQGIRIKG